jgi:hypothetical protein
VSRHQLSPGTCRGPAEELGPTVLEPGRQLTEIRRRSKPRPGFAEAMRLRIQRIGIYKA